MIIVVDAYNVIKQFSADTHISEQERNEYIKIFMWYAQMKKHRLLVVFDGGPYEWHHKEKKSKLVTVVYSGRHETADHFIEKYLENHISKDILLVSSDHELGLIFSKKKKPSIDVYDFMDLVRQTVKNKVNIPVFPQSFEDIEDLDALMEQASEQVYYKEEDFQPTQDRRSSAEKMSKRERVLWQKLKKL